MILTSNVFYWWVEIKGGMLALAISSAGSYFLYSMVLINSAET